MADIVPFQQSVIIDTDDQDDVETSGDETVIALPDGNVVVDLSPPRRQGSDGKFGDNLAMRMDDVTLGRMAEDLLTGIAADVASRSEWESTRSRGIELLGLKIEDPRDNPASGSAPLEGMSSVRHPLLLEAVLRAQANASAELLPASGPAKVENDGEETAADDQQAEALERDFNRYLTKIATEYYPDTRRTLFWTTFGGSGFKKLYHCPIRRRPVSESVDANDLIVSNAATDLANAPRITHRIKMMPSVMRRMQIVEAYRDLPLPPATGPASNQVEQAKEAVEGVRPTQTRPEDQPYELYECYCEYDLDEYAPRQFKGKELPLPYKVTIEKDSRKILEVRRFWEEDDEQCMRKRRWVKYPYVEGFGFYGIGLVHILGNTAAALTALEREGIDAGMYANFPGGLVSEEGSRQNTNEFRVAPGSFAQVKTGGKPIGSMVMPMPYKDVTPGLMALMDKLNEMGSRLGGTAELPVGEGKQDAPVGTTLALIEQATKVESAVHKGLHSAQADELEILLELFREDPEAFWRHNPKARGSWSEQTLLATLGNYKLVPVSDPNTPSHLHRIAKALAIKQLQAANPQLYDAKAVDERVLRMIKVEDAESLFAPPAPAAAGPDPKALEAQAKLVGAEANAAKVRLAAQTNAETLAQKDRALQSAKDIATVNLAKELVIHGDQNDMQNRQHGLDVMQHAHQAGMDIHNALTPEPTKPTKS